ncbi:MAG: chorismate-binding protein [Flavobacteriaceae bacterium]|nr:chorismate-binding protein [Flavobacteriaceae bacterium]
MRVTQSIPIADPQAFKAKLREWANCSETAVFLDSNGHQDAYSSASAIFAEGVVDAIGWDPQDGFEALQRFKNEKKDWLFGYLGYDLKNELEDLESLGQDGLGFPELYFFQPQKIVRLLGETAEFQYWTDVHGSLAQDIRDLMRPRTRMLPKVATSPIKIKLRIKKEAYHQKVEALQEHIHRGDIYEANFCQEFYAENVRIDPMAAYENLNTLSEAPFSAFAKFKSRFLLSASPERYLKRSGKQLITQPIKGTAPRSEDPSTDRKIGLHLEQDPKERAENIMITDLVRNDLSKHAQKGSVTVEELCKVYSFKQVHQLISTISCSVATEIDSVQLIKSTFPMGSMTGAPKLSAMRLIEKFERTKRGVYSGALGYFTPEDDFDYSVVIRSILYDAESGFLSFSVGSAITAKSKAANEYEECLLKAKAMRKVLEGDGYP